MPTQDEIAAVVVKHLPPSVDRVRVRPLDAAARAWANALTRSYFVAIVDTGACDATLGTDLSLLPHVALRPGGRAIFLLASGRRSLSELAAILSDAGFTRILAEPVLGGVFTLVRGEPRLAAVEHPAEISVQSDELLAPVAGDRLPRYLHLLVHQEPPLRGWEQPAPAAIVWDALTIRDRAGDRRLLLGFSSLVRAVEFMKPAAVSGAFPEVNKLPRYRGDTVAGWAMPVLLNPAFEALRADDRFAFDAPPLRVDPRLEDKLRE
jgi:hypothetical protein